MDICEPFKRDWVLRNTGVEEVWGIGKRMTAHLAELGIRKAMDLALAAPRLLREKFSVVVEKTARELTGTRCLALEEADPPKQEICCSRTFSDDLFAQGQPLASGRLMSVLDEVNGRYGRGTLRAGSVPGTPEWGMRRGMMSPSYTTRVEQLWTVYSR